MTAPRVSLFFCHFIRGICKARRRKFKSKQTSQLSIKVIVVGPHLRNSVCILRSRKYTYIQYQAYFVMQDYWVLVDAAGHTIHSRYYVNCMPANGLNACPCFVSPAVNCDTGYVHMYIDSIALGRKHQQSCRAPTRPSKIASSPKPDQNL